MLRWAKHSLPVCESRDAESWCSTLRYKYDYVLRRLAAKNEAQRQGTLSRFASSMRRQPSNCLSEPDSELTDVHSLKLTRHWSAGYLPAGCAPTDREFLLYTYAITILTTSTWTSNTFAKDRRVCIPTLHRSHLMLFRNCRHQDRGWSGSSVSSSGCRAISSNTSLTWLYASMLAPVKARWAKNRTTNSTGPKYDLTIPSATFVR